MDGASDFSLNIVVDAVAVRVRTPVRDTDVAADATLFVSARPRLPWGVIYRRDLARETLRVILCLCLVFVAIAAETDGIIIVARLKIVHIHIHILFIPSFPIQCPLCLSHTLTILSILSILLIGPQPIYVLIASTQTRIHALICKIDIVVPNTIRLHNRRSKLLIRPVPVPVQHLPKRIRSDAGIVLSSFVLAARPPTPGCTEKIVLTLVPLAALDALYALAALLLSTTPRSGTGLTRRG
ncbi:LOW QUALITY PROTEIN: hypothetical protein CVT25_004047 [Psilocybe cyanescens]|uniref:Uncharacterized protein n=1 Tax=Psilocybe cyanescens TaxID=93625 RepID=A0A409WXL3_PSICY|nr:LOW QUALITY PROTEIN: hypothetical protein CVT25_004047 [Psilocybe cyanescens]